MGESDSSNKSNYESNNNNKDRTKKPEASGRLNNRLSSLKTMSEDSIGSDRLESNEFNRSADENDDD